MRGRLRRGPDSQRVLRIDPWPLNFRRRAVAAVRSYSRAPAYGPRSITGTRTTRPRWRRVTRVPHGSDLWATPSWDVPRPSAAPGPVAVEAGAVPRRERVAVDVQPPQAVLAGRAAAHAHASARAHRAGHAVAQDVPPLRVRAVTIERDPAAVAPDLQRDRRAGGLDPAAHDGAPAHPHVQTAVAHPDLGGRGGGCGALGVLCERAARAWRPRRDIRNRACRRTARHANRAWASK